MKKSIKIVFLMIVLCPMFVYATNKDIITKITNEKETSTELIEDGTVDNNIRYIGANPKNYISFNGETWRIIGLMNHVKDASGTPKTRVKLIRPESLGRYSWNITETGVNSGQGINNWETSYLKDLLNTKGYWDSTSTVCGNGANGATTTCDFSSTGLKEDDKDLIAEVEWNLGSNWDNNYKEAKGEDFYNYLLSGKGGNYCTSGIFCNDTVERTTSWVGKVGLMNSADYIMATDGGDANTRYACLNSVVIKDWDDNNPECYNNDWLTTSTEMWTMAPYTDSTYNTTLFYTRNKLGMRAAYYTYGIRPSLFLEENILIIDGEGTESNPYQILPYEEVSYTLPEKESVNLEELIKETFNLEEVDFKTLEIDDTNIAEHKEDNLISKQAGTTELLVQKDRKAYVINLEVTRVEEITNPKTASNIVRFGILLLLLGITLYLTKTTQKEG